MTVRGKISVRIEAHESRDIDGLGGNADYRHLVEKAVGMANGVASGQVDFAYSVESQAVTDTGVSYTLVGSALQSILDQTTDIDMDEIILVYIENLGGGSGNDLLVGAGSNPIPGIVETEATHRTRIKAGGWHAYYFGPGGVALTAAVAEVVTLDCAAAEDTTAAVVFIGK